MRETWVGPLCREDPWEKGFVTHSSTLAWRIPRTEKPGRLHSIGSQESCTTEQLSTHTLLCISALSLVTSPFFISNFDDLILLSCFFSRWVWLKVCQFCLSFQRTSFSFINLCYCFFFIYFCSYFYDSFLLLILGGFFLFFFFQS